MKLSQADLGEYLGFTRMTIWRWEHGREDCPVWLEYAIAGLARGLEKGEGK